MDALYSGPRGLAALLERLAETGRSAHRDDAGMGARGSFPNERKGRPSRLGQRAPPLCRVYRRGRHAARRDSPLDRRHETSPFAGCRPPLPCLGFSYKGRRASVRARSTTDAFRRTEDDDPLARGSGRQTRAPCRAKERSSAALLPAPWWESFRAGPRRSRGLPQTIAQDHGTNLTPGFHPEDGAGKKAPRPRALYLSSMLSMAARMARSRACEGREPALTRRAGERTCASAWPLKLPRLHSHPVH